MRRMLVRSVCGSALLIVVAACAVACTKPVQGSGNVVSRSFPVRSFSKLQVSHGFTVHVSFGAPAAVSVRIDDNLVDDLDVAVSGDTLRIALKGDVSVTDATEEATITVATLTAIEASGASTVTSSEPFRTSLDVSLSGASSFTGELGLDDGSVQLSGASRAVLSGSAKSVSITLSGASEVAGAELSIDALTIDLSGASHGDVTVTGTISAAASGASDLTYSGTPTITRQDVSGGSSITHA